MGKKKPTIEVNLYNMSVHLGLCHGPVDELIALYVGEKEAWVGPETVQGSVQIDKPDLFGGDRKEGGVKGNMHFLPGNSTQLLPAGIAARLGLTPATSPAFRGICSLWFSGAESGGGGFYWTANQPNLRGIWATVRRIYKGLSPAFAQIGGEANPASIIYECLTDTDWGIGLPATDIDVPSFEYAAEVLFNENFGLSMIWVQQAKVEDFISEVLDHIQATLFLNPRTGLLTVKLIRDDYDLDTVPVLNPDNCVVTSFQRKSWGETVNEITVSWTNPTNEQEETVTLQDLGNIAIQGGIVSDTRNYYGARNPGLAMALAARDLRTASTPLAGFTIEVNRAAWDFLPGEVVKLVYPEYGIAGLALRITDINYGRPGEDIIKISALEDIFSLPISSYAAPPVSEWVDTSEAPAPTDYSVVVTLPWYFLTNALTDADLEAAEYPEVAAGILALPSGSDTFGYELTGEVVLPNGNSEYTSLGQRSIPGRYTLASPLVAEAQTVVSSFPAVTGSVQPAENIFLLIGEDEATQEIVFISDFDGVNYTLERGVLDTVPMAHSAGEVVWVVDVDVSIADTTVRNDGDVVEYKLLTQTSLGKLDAGSAPVLSGTLTDRPYLPYRPADVKVEGVGFGNVNVNLPATDIEVTWANRNRTFEDNQVFHWDDATTTPESGQTVTVRLYDNSMSVLASYPGLSGTMFNLPTSAFGVETEGWVEVSSQRDGFDSLQAHRVHVTLIP